LEILANQCDCILKDQEKKSTSQALKEAKVQTTQQLQEQSANLDALDLSSTIKHFLLKILFYKIVY